MLQNLNRRTDFHDQIRATVRCSFAMFYNNATDINIVGISVYENIWVIPY